MEQVKNVIQKATIKGDRCEVTYKEKHQEENYTNEVAKKCDQIIHYDLKNAFSALRPFLITITEQSESSLFNSRNIDQEPTEAIENEISKYIVTGYSHGGSDESAGVTIIGQKLLKSGQVLNLIAPFTKFMDEGDDSYDYSNELSAAIDACDFEVSQYLFNEKYGIRQVSLDFECDAPIEADLELSEKKGKKKGRSKKAIEAPVVFDQTA